MIRMRGALFTSDAHMDQTRVRADSSELRQVFRNILENALAPELDAMSNRIQVKIHAGWRDVELNEGRGLEVTIRDNGPGFSDGNCERIFEPFFTTKARGTGLGMSICRRIIEAHGGSIRAACAADGGLEIVIRLPYSQNEVIL